MNRLSLLTLFNLVFLSACQDLDEVRVVVPEAVTAIDASLLDRGDACENCDAFRQAFADDGGRFMEMGVLEDDVGFNGGLEAGFDVMDATGRSSIDGGTLDAMADALADVATALCGNGIIEAGEACDDGNQIDQDWCTNQCQTHQVCGALPVANACADRDQYVLDLEEHIMQDIDGCVFALDTPSPDQWHEGHRLIQRLAERLGSVRTIEEVLADLNRVGELGISPYNATRLRNHEWVGFRWNEGDNDVDYWYPQGITGSSDARDASRVSNRRLLMVSWYHKTPERPTRGVRVSLADITNLNRISYRHLLLVEPYGRANGTVNFRAANTESGNALHAGGIVWFGRYLFVADTRHGIRVFDMHNILEIPDVDDHGAIGIDGGRIAAHGYKYAVPQLARYTQSTAACPLVFSSLGLDRSTSPPTLVSAEYRASDAQARLVHWPIDVTSGLLLDIDRQTRGRSAKSIAQTRVQGALSWRGAYYVSSSSQYLNYGRLYRTRSGMTSTRTAWVYGAEDLYYERSSGLIWTPAEHPGFRDTVGIPLLPP